LGMSPTPPHGFTHHKAQVKSFFENHNYIPGLVFDFWEPWLLTLRISLITVRGSIHLFLFLITTQDCGNITHGYKY
jgi:hypothetical protein